MTHFLGVTPKDPCPTCVPMGTSALTSEDCPTCKRHSRGLCGCPLSLVLSVPRAQISVHGLRWDLPRVEMERAYRDTGRRGAAVAAYLSTQGWLQLPGGLLAHTRLLSDYMCPPRF